MRSSQHPKLEKSGTYLQVGIEKDTFIAQRVTTEPQLAAILSIMLKKMHRLSTLTVPSDSPKGASVV